MASDLDKRIQDRAYEIWESEGRPEGRSREHWERARAEFSEAKSEAAAKSGGRKARAAGEGGQGSRAKGKSGTATAKPRSGAKSGSAESASERAESKTGTAKPKGARSARTGKI